MQHNKDIKLKAKVNKTPIACIVTLIACIDVVCTRNRRQAACRSHICTNAVPKTSLPFIFYFFRFLPPSFRSVSCLFNKLFNINLCNT